MKTFFLSLLLAVTALWSISCDRGDAISSGVDQVASSGSWRVTLFSDSGNDETSDFTGYTFTFDGGGTLTVVKSGATQTGTWSVSGSSNKFIINLGPKDDSNKPFGELTDDWKILSYTATAIRLADDNTSSSEFLTFTKN